MGDGARSFTPGLFPQVFSSPVLSPLGIFPTRDFPPRVFHPVPFSSRSFLTRCFSFRSFPPGPSPLGLLPTRSFPPRFFPHQFSYYKKIVVIPEAYVTSFHLKPSYFENINQLRSLK